MNINFVMIKSNHYMLHKILIPRILPYVILLTSAAALIIAYTLESFGLHPCKLCIYQRVVYYILISVAMLMLCFMYKNQNKRDLKVILLEYIIYGLLIFSIGLGLFQVLIENHILTYESTCTTQMSNIQSPEDLMNVIQQKDLIACDIPQLKILHISLAGWNALYTVGVLSIALFVRYKRSS